MDEQKLLEKLQLIEALFAGTPYAGERSAAAEAMERIRERLRATEKTEKAVEFKFKTSDLWSRKLLIALLRRYEIKPYRYRGQRYTTVMAKLPKRFVNETLWPEFRQLSDTLRQYLEEITNKIISESIFPDTSDAAESEGTEPAQVTHDH